jgi:hypothetical protein
MTTQFSRALRAAPRLAATFVIALLALAVAHIAPAHAESVSMLGFGLSTLTATNPTLLDLAKRLDPNGSIADIVEILNQTNEVLSDMTWIEGNLTTGHRTTVRTGIPTPTWRKMYQGVQPGKSTTAQITDTCGMLEAYSRVDKAMADLGGNAAAFRLSEDKGHLEGLSQQVASTLFYGNETTQPEAFTGLAPRFSSVSTTTAESADNVIDGGGTGSDNASIWLVVWGDRTVHGIIPKGSKAGFQQRDLGEITVQNSDGSMFQAYVTHFRWDAGLTVRDWRYVVRICNIDVSDQATLANTKNLVTFMTKALEHVPNLNAGRPVFYMNRILRESLRLGIIEKTATQLTWDTVAGQHVMNFSGVPVRRSDALLNTEARIV